MSVQQVTGIGGVFFKSSDPKALAEWYATHLGLVPAPDDSVVIGWRGWGRPEEEGCTVWSLFKQESGYFSPSASPFMINYRVMDLEGLLKTLNASGIPQVGTIERLDYGDFAWVMDPEGNKIELWQPSEGPNPFGVSVPPMRSGTGGAATLVRSEDPRVSAAWYQDVLGFVGAVDDMGGALQLGMGRIRILPSEDPDPSPRPLLLLEVPSLDRARQRCAAADAPIHKELPGGAGFVVEDPDGHKVAVVPLA